jgi:RNA polymerase sigma-70 factor (ECF subfamily)
MVHPRRNLGLRAASTPFYAANFVPLTTQLYAYFGDRPEAEDVVQEAFCRALARWRQISVYEDPAAWVRRVAWNLATCQLRRSVVASAFRRRQRPEYYTPGPDLELHDGR